MVFSPGVTVTIVAHPLLNHGGMSAGCVCISRSSLTMVGDHFSQYARHCGANLVHYSSESEADCVGILHVFKGTI